MRRPALLAILVLCLSTAPATARGFHFFHRPVETRAFYYYPSNVYYMPAAQPVYYTVSPPVFASHPVVVSPPLTYSQWAIPVAAPASGSREFPQVVPPRRGTTEEPPTSLSLRAGAASHSVLPGPKGMDRGDGRCSVAFWNLTPGALALRVDGQDHVIPAGRSLTLELARSFVWRVAGREAEASSIPAGRPTAEVLIRR